MTKDDITVTMETAPTFDHPHHRRDRPGYGYQVVAMATTITQWPHRNTQVPSVLRLESVRTHGQWCHLSDWFIESPFPELHG